MSAPGGPRSRVRQPCRDRYPASVVRFLRVAAALAALAVLAASCGADFEVALPDTLPTPSGAESPSTDPPQPTELPAPTPTPLPDGLAVLPEDLLLEPGPRIAIETSDGQIFTVLGDGSNAVPLTNPAEAAINSLPTWSRDANRLAWTTSSSAGSSSWVRSARFDGSDFFEQDVDRVPFGLSWDPSGSQLAAVAATDNGNEVELGVISLAEGGYTSVDTGSPFWYSWSPDADGFLVHASGLRLDLVPIDGATQVLEEFPGSFQAPRWLDGAVQLIYADEIDDQDFLVVTGVEGAGRRALVTYDGYLQFVVSPASGVVALQVIDESRAPIPDVITASFQRDEGPPVDLVDRVARNELTVIATFGGDPLILHPDPNDFTPRPVIAFYWSPDGATLAWLVEIDAGSGDCASETALYEWQFYIGGFVQSGPRFTPTPTFACDYVPFFDQLDQSITFWSPDGTLLTYAGTDQATGERGVFNVSINDPGRPVLIAEGEVGVWSPETAGSAAASSL